MFVKHTKTQSDAQDAPTDATRGIMVTTIQLKLSRSRGGVGVGTIADKDEDKDTEHDVDENKDLMKNDSVQSLSYTHLPTPKLPTSVALLMSNLAELINNVTSSSSSSSLSLSLLGGG